MNFARASIATAAAASALALFAPAAGAQVPSVELPPLPDVPAINAAAPDSAISGQYHEIAAAVEKALPPVPAAAPAAAPPAAPPPAPKPAPEYHPKAPQYHSETAPDVSVTQTQPTNVNVSIRINSPGDDGPVVQVNGAGADVVTNVVNHVADARDAGAADSAAGGLPDDWTWIWTSACFGGGASAPAGAAAATSGPHWDWQWSCDQDVPAGVSMPGPDNFPGLGPMSDPVAAALSPPLDALGVGQAEAAKPRAGPRHHERAPDTAAAAGGSSDPPTQGTGGSLLTGAPELAVRSTATVAAHVGAAARHAVQARARPAGSDTDLSTFPSGAGGLAASAASGSTAAMSLLLAGWTAVLVCALAMAIPQIWRPGWSGPPLRKPAPRAMRLERPG